MPRGFMDDLEGEVAGEEVHEGGFGEDILSADLTRDDAVIQHPRCLALADVKHLIELFQGRFALFQHGSLSIIVVYRRLTRVSPLTISILMLSANLSFA